MQLIKLIVSSLLFGWDRCFRRRAGQPGTCVFLTYHTITAQTREKFAHQMAMLKETVRVIASPTHQRFDRGCHYVVITFDDAFRSFAENALPVLKNLQLPVMLFVPTGYLGRKSTWFDYGTENPVGEDVVSVDELKQLVSQHTIEIGSHTVNHPNLVEISDEESRAEFRDSRETLESLLGRKVNSISFPYGSYGEREMKLAQENGYDFCFTVLPQTSVGSIQPGLVGRVSVQPTDSDFEFKLKVFGAYRWLTWASAWKRKLGGQRVSPATLMNESQAHG